MREPTQEMIDAGIKAWSPMTTDRDFKEWESEAFSAVYQAMIAAALGKGIA